MDHTIAQTKSLDAKVFLLRSSKPERCTVCGLRRILFAIALHPPGLTTETWMCGEDMGIRVPGVSVDPSPPPGSVSLWDQTKVEDFVANLQPPDMPEGTEPTGEAIEALIKEVSGE